MAATLSPAIPVLRIFDLAKARGFYVDFLGFRVDWEHRYEPGMPVYMQVSRDGLTIHLTEHHGDACPGSSLRARVSDIDEYHREVSAKGYGFMRPGIESTPWKTREMGVIDPFGNRIHFYAEIAKAAGGDAS